MRIGLIISSSAHLALIVWAIIGGWFLSPRESEVVKLADVSVISQAEFDAALSGAPEPQELALEAPEPPAAETPPEAPAVQSAPEPPRDVARADPAEAVEAAPALTLSPQEFETPEAPATPGAELARPGASTGADAPTRLPQSQLAQSAPERTAPRIDTTPAPKPPEPVREAEAKVEETAPSVEEAEPQEKEEKAAPKEATTEITLDKPAESTAALEVAARPKGRPRGLKAKQDKAAEVAKAEPAKEETKPVDTAPKTEAAAPKATPERLAQEPSRYVLGSDMSRVEKFAVSGQIEKSWNIASFEGRPNWQSLVVVVDVQLTQTGKVLKGTIKPVDPASPSGDHRVAYQAARRAILLAQPYTLPKDKFRDGDWLRIRFNPAQGGVTLN